MHSEKLAINKPKIVIYGIMIGVIVTAIIVNRNLSTLRDVVSNFMVPSLMLYFGLSQDSINKIGRIILLFIGLTWFGYITLYYLIGFHNHNWGN